MVQLCRLTRKCCLAGMGSRARSQTLQYSLVPHSVMRPPQEDAAIVGNDEKSQRTTSPLPR